MTSRIHEPIEYIEVGEELTTCTHCGSRTELIRTFSSSSRQENCIACGQQYVVTDAEDEEDEPYFEPSEMTMKESATPTLDGIIKDIMMSDATEEDLNHLFGKQVSHPDWGKF